MKVIVAGSRSFAPDDEPEIAKTNRIWVFERLDNLMFDDPYETWPAINPTEIVCGMAKGPDIWGAEWAKKRKIPVKEFPADWDKYGKAAGFIRNGQMANYADCLIAFWDGKSRGTDHMIHVALEEGLEIHVYQATV